jgi:hypothetical protein
VVSSAGPEGQKDDERGDDRDARGDDEAIAVAGGEGAGGVVARLMGSAVGTELTAGSRHPRVDRGLRERAADSRSGQDIGPEASGGRTGVWHLMLDIA